jgi:hypothetical protein
LINLVSKCRSLKYHSLQQWITGRPRPRAKPGS